MKIRVLSDLHLDVNNFYGYPINMPQDYDKDIFTLVCGDIAGDLLTIKTWIENNVNRGLFIAGNHLVYSNEYEYDTIEKRKEFLAKNFPITNNVTFLDFEHVIAKEIENTNILVIGSTLFTDYKFKNNNMLYLSDDEVYHNNKVLAERFMNDFKVGFTYDKLLDYARKLTPEDYEIWHKQTLDKISEIVKNNPTKDIIIMTHHCPSAKCILSKYITDKMNASYCSNLDDFILQNPNIKAWACGHIHGAKNFKIGQCTVVLNPIGYVCIGEQSYYSYNTFLDTDTWDVCNFV